MALPMWRDIVASMLCGPSNVFDLCISKLPLQWLPPTSTIADATTELEGLGRRQESGVAGRVCMANVLLFLYATAT